MKYLFCFRFWLLGAVLLAATALGPGVRSAMRVDNSLTVWFLERDPALRAYTDFRERFGNDEVVIVVVHDSTGVLNPPYLKTLPALTEALEALPFVEQVAGAGNAVLPTFGVLGTGTRPLLRPTSTARQVQGELTPYPTLRRSLFSDDYRAARLLIQLRALPDFDERRAEYLSAVRQTVGRYLPAERVAFGGVGVVYEALNTLSQHDFGLFVGLGYLLMFALLLVMYRSAWLLTYALGVVGLSTWLTFGVYGALGYRVNLMTVMLPLILVILGLLDVMHVINERNRLLREEIDAPANGTQTARRALRYVWMPCLFTTLTTMAGFLSLLTSPIAILRTFGVFSALGIGLCFGLTFLLGAILLPAVPPRFRTGQATWVVASRLVPFYEHVLRRARPWGLVSLSLVLGSVIGLFRLTADTYTLGYLPDRHRVVTDDRLIESAWGPYVPLELLIEPKAGRTLTDPAVVRATFAFTDSVRTIPGVGRVEGYHTLLEAGLEMRYRQQAPARRTDAAALEKARAQLRRTYPALERAYWNAASETGRLTVSGTMLTARQLAHKMDTLRRMAAVTLGPVATVRPAGYQPLYARIVAYVTRSQVESLLLSFGWVFGLTWLFVRRFRLAVLALLPNLLPVLVLLGAMGWLEIPLDTATACIAAIVLSVCVDDTIHFVYHYQQYRRHERPDEARRRTVREVGPAVVLTSSVLILGFGVLLLGSLRTVQVFGLLTVLSLVAALFGELVAFPLLLRLFDR